MPMDEIVDLEHVILTKQCNFNISNILHSSTAYFHWINYIRQLNYLAYDALELKNILV